MTTETFVAFEPHASRFEQFVWFLDERLRRWEHIYEYSERPDCIFRIHNAEVAEALQLSPQVQIRPGDPVVHLHLWNEHMPPIGPDGPTLKWAMQLSRQLNLSLTELAKHLAKRSELRPVRAVCGEMIVASSRQTNVLGRIVEHLGFAVLPESVPSFRERFRRGGENILALLIVTTSNPRALRGGVFSRGHIRMCMPRAVLDRRYG